MLLMRADDDDLNNQGVPADHVEAQETQSTSVDESWWAITTLPGVLIASLEIWYHFSPSLPSVNNARNKKIHCSDSLLNSSSINKSCVLTATLSVTWQNTLKTNISPLQILTCCCQSCFKYKTKFLKNLSEEKYLLHLLLYIKLSK